MTRASWSAMIFLTGTCAALAQNAPAAASLDATQQQGQKLFYQSCGVCHTKPQITATQFAPVLSKETASGNESAIRQIIAEGTPRMPGFKHHFDATQIAAIAAYVMAIPAPPLPAPASTQR